MLIGIARKKQIFHLKESPLYNSSIISDIVEVKSLDVSFLCVEFIYFVSSCILCCLVSDFSFTVLLTYGGFIVKLRFLWTTMPAYQDINLWSIQSLNNSLIITREFCAFSFCRFSDISLKQFTLRRIQWLQHILKYIHTHNMRLSQTVPSAIIAKGRKKELKRKGIKEKGKNSSYHQGPWTQTDNLKLKHFTEFTQRPCESNVRARLLGFAELSFCSLRVRKIQVLGVSR